jgi:hypothetical protein|nr:MAG: hypothetical protein J07AB56_02650 [Candidatus Nanosalinarum sp. J07AB56]
MSDGSMLGFAQQLENTFEKVMPQLEDFREGIDRQLQLAEEILQDEKNLVKVERADEEDIERIIRVVSDLEDITETGNQSREVSELETIASQELGDAIEAARELDGHQDQELKQERADDDVILEIRRTRDSKRKFINFVEGDDFTKLVEMEEQLGMWVEGSNDPRRSVADIYQRISSEMMSAEELQEMVEEHENKLEELMAKLTV